MPHVLFLDANWDLVTEYLYSFRTHFVINHLNGSRYTVHQLVERDLVQPNLDHILRTQEISYISGAGHGVYDAFTGFQNIPVWSTATPLPPLDDVIVHLLSCQTARELGRAMIDAGARAFWGYQEDFRFRRKKSPPPFLYDDTTALLAIMMDCLIDIGILRGESPERIYMEVSDYVNQTTSNLGPFDFNRAILNHNLRHLVCPAVHWGDRFGTI